MSNQGSHNTAGAPVSNLVWELADAATDPAVGDAFFTNLVRQLSVSVGVRHAFVAESVPGHPERLRTRAFVSDGKMQENLEYSVLGTPCEAVVGRELCWIGSGVRGQYPGNELLARLGAEAYVGLPLFNSNQELLGAVVLLHDAPVAKDENLRHLLRICASRAGAELERVRVAGLLRASEERLRACIETTPHVAVQFYDEAGNVRLWNKASEDLYGVPASKVLGKPVGASGLTPEAARRFAEVLERVRATQRSSGPQEFQVLRKDGSIGHIESTVFPIPGEGGSRWYVCMDADVTAKVRAQEELRASERHYRHLIESSPLAMLVTDLQQRVIFANTKFAELFGYTIGDVPSLTAWWPKICMEPVQRAKMEQEWGARLQAAFATGKPVEPLDLDVVCSDGASRRVQACVSLCSDRILVVFTDLTDRIRLEHELRQAQKLEIVGQLAGGVAHDFNNIIQAVLGFIGLAQDPSLTTPDRDVYLREALAAAKRASQLTRQLLAFGRRQPLHMEDTPLPELVTNLLKLLRRLIGEHIELSLVTGRNLGLVRCDRTQIEQVLINLCVNSRDAMPNGGRITITLENKTISNSYHNTHPWAKVGRFMLVSVTDTGTGMDKATQEHVFEPFFTTKPKDKGTGLGLSVVYGIVRQHEGFIRLYSEPGMGTTFRIYLPVVEVPVGAPGTKETADPAPGGSETILVAEDDETIRNLVKRILTRAGYEVLTAVDGEEAIRLFESNASRVDLLLFDAVMPRLGGFEAYTRISSLCGRPIPAIFASGYNDAFTHSSVQLPENTLLMQKPYDPDDLLRKIRQIIASRASVRTS